MFQSPTPGVAKPQRGQEMQLGRFRSAIESINGNQDIIGFRLGIFDKYIKIAIFSEGAGIKQFVFRLAFATPMVGLYQVRIRERPAVDICRASSYKNGSAWNQDKNNIPLRLLRDSLPGR